MVDTKISDLVEGVPVWTGDEMAWASGGANFKSNGRQVVQMVTQKGGNTASAGTLVLGDGLYFHITGTTTITDIDFTDSWDGRIAFLIFDGSLTLTHNGTTLQLPGKANIQTQAGDRATVIVDSGDNVIVLHYERAEAAELTNVDNASTAAQSPAANSVVYITGSALAIPSSGLRVGSTFYWRLAFAKTGAGTAAKSIIVKLGTAGSTADTSLLTFALGAGTAVIDEGWADIFVTCRGPLGASAIFQGHIAANHRLATTGLFVTQFAGTPLLATSAGFNSAQAGLIMGLALSTGASEAWTFSQVIAQARTV